MNWFRDLGVRVRLSAALAVMFGLMLLVSVIGMSVLNRTELWMNVLHRDTLTEVTAAMDLSRDASDLATSAPFLFAMFAPYQMEHEVAGVKSNLERVRESSARDPALDLPIARLGLAIDDLSDALLPQTSRSEDLNAIDRDLVRLNARSERMANDASLTLEDRQSWAGLQQLTIIALGAARAEALIELGGFVGDYRRQSAELEVSIPGQSPQWQTFDEITQTMQRRDGLFVLKHSNLSAQLDAENALFRIRQETSRISAFAETKVAQAEERLSQARAATSDTLAFARNAFLALIVVSLGVAVTSALYVSRHVARNLERIADAMRRLAAGNLRAELPAGPASRDEIGQLFAAFQVFRDNARKLDRRTAQIRHQNALFSRVFRNIKDGIAVGSGDGRILAENDNLRRLLRLPPAQQGASDRIADLIGASAFRRQTPADERGGFEEYIDPDGNVLEMHRSPLPDDGQVWLVSETTERKRVEARLEAIRRVEALGKVSGEVAHDFGNILSSISGNLHLMEHADADRRRALQERLGAAIDMGTSLTERLLAFARKQHLAAQVTDMGELVTGIAEFLEIAIPDGVALEVEVPPAPVLCLVDPGQLESAILNLCVNAGQAIDGEGRIVVTVRGDGMARVTVRDTGCGMSDDVLRHATDPFFTRRAESGGTGLGLSMVDGFVHQSGGQLSIRSSTSGQDRGTTITMSFPLAAAPAAPNAPGHAGRILVVDDDPANLQVVSRSLEQMGMAVARACSYAEAVRALTEAEDLNLVLTDLTLDEGFSGLDVIELARDRFPQCRLGIMSTRTLADDFAVGATVLAKPLSDPDLHRLVDRLPV